MKDIFFSCTDQSGAFSEETFRNAVNSNKEALYTAQKGEKRYSVSLGWHDVDEWAGEKWLSEYESLAAKVRKDADALVVIGIGGSNQAARAVYEALGCKSQVEIIWAGNSISAHSICDVIRSLENKKNIYIDELLELIKKHKKNRDVYIVGSSNVGKSKLVNQIIREKTKTKNQEKVCH